MVPCGDQWSISPLLGFWFKVFSYHLCFAHGCCIIVLCGLQVQDEVLPCLIYQLLLLQQSECLYIILFFFTVAFPEVLLFVFLWSLELNSIVPQKAWPVPVHLTRYTCLKLNKTRHLSKTSCCGYQTSFWVSIAKTTRDFCLLMGDPINRIAYIRISCLTVNIPTVNIWRQIEMLIKKSWKQLLRLMPCGGLIDVNN